MATANERLLDEAIRHSVELHQYSNSIVHKMIAVLNRSDSRLFSALIDALSRIDPDSFTVERLQDLLASVRQLNAAAFKEVQKALTVELADFLVFEADYQRAMLVSAIPVQVPVAAVSIAQVRAAAVSRPFQGVLLREVLSELDETRARLVRRTIAQGFTEGKSIDAIVRELRGTRAKGYADGLFNRARRDVEAIVRTAVSHYAKTVRQEMADNNQDLIKALRWVSTLDSRTSAFCRIRDGRLYDPKTFKPIDHDLPWGGGPGAAHWNCRSVSVPVLKSWKELGSVVDIPEFKPATRASMDGQVPADLSYADWIKQQPFARQVEVLGETRARLLRDGGADLGDFYGAKGRYLSLAEMRERYAEMFKKAGL